MRWLPHNWNDAFAWWVFTVSTAVDVWLVGYSGVEREVVTLILGAQFGWIAGIVTYYWRKAPPSNGQEGGQ